MSIRNQILKDILSAIGGGGSVLWGSITGTIADQTDLAAVAKTNNYNDLNNKPSPWPEGTVFFVHKAGNDSNSGLTPELPKLTISDAISDAMLLSPSEANQITIEVMDTGNYVESVTLSEWVHLNAVNAAIDGRLTVEDNTVSRVRRLLNSAAGVAVIRKNDGAGFAKVSVELLIVADSGQEGLQVNAGVMHIDVAVITINAGIGIKAKNGSRVSFIVSEVQITNGGLGIGTRTSGGDPNFFSGNILYAKDDGTGTLLEAKVSGDTINIQGGSLIVDTLYDMGVNTVLNVFATESGGARITDPTATVNATIAGFVPDKTLVSLGFTTQALALHNGLAATETSLDFGTASNEVFDINGGVIELLQPIARIQVLTEIHVSKVSGGSDSEFSSWIEVSTDSGVSWNVFPDSLRVEVMAKDGGSVFISDLSFNTPISAGDMFRMIATNTGASAISVMTPTDVIASNGTATGFSTKISIR